MSQHTRAVSVIVPNYNRSGALSATLSSLARQTLSPDAFEVVLVDDGSSDGSLALVNGLQPELPYPLVLLHQENRGPSAARNRGAQAARHDLLLFWDSDMIAGRRTLDVHRTLHPDNTPTLVAGARQPWVPATTSLFDRTLRANALGRDHLGQAPSFWEAFSSNLSIDRRDFDRLDGFDEDLWAFEDTDLAYRSQRAGLALIFSREAIGYHNHPLSLHQACLQQRRYQRYAAAFLVKHPELKGEIDYLQDKDPIRLRSDAPGLVVRKAARQAVASPCVLFLLRALVPLVERRWPEPRLLSFLYWKVLASFQLIGYREGLREFR